MSLDICFTINLSNSLGNKGRIYEIGISGGLFGFGIMTINE